ncbi:hypothetical protein AB0H83_31965 [Dactylosporangium sp. NPDC050688]|uniref:hypothetical protein n=1 Tax=Dactylosporangium sp. NPDC050688 TaxID=3157217 RepID=UPI00340ED37F
MTALASLLCDSIPNAEPATDIDGVWTWSFFHLRYVAALSADGEYFHRINVVDDFDATLVRNMVRLLRERHPGPAAAPVTVVAGLDSPGFAFDTVVIAGQDVCNHDEVGVSEIAPYSPSRRARASSPGGRRVTRRSSG